MTTQSWARRQRANSAMAANSPMCFGPGRSGRVRPFGFALPLSGNSLPNRLGFRGPRARLRSGKSRRAMTKRLRGHRRRVTTSAIRWSTRRAGEQMYACRNMATASGFGRMIICSIVSGAARPVAPEICKTKGPAYGRPLARIRRSNDQFRATTGFAQLKRWPIPNLASPVEEVVDTEQDAMDVHIHII